MSTVDSSGRRLTIFDTTLRDGEQAPGNAMSPECKLEIATWMERLGVDAIEVGFPASSKSEFTAAQLISEHLTTARLVTFSRANRKDIELAVQAAGTRNHQVQTMATGSDMHLVHKRGITRKEAVDEVVDAVLFARSLGITDISIPIEDASRGDDDLLRAITEGALEAGALTFVIGDTSGGMTPEEYGELIAKFCTWAPAPAVISTHCHNDFGLASANALAGVTAGAVEVQATLGGIGERAGNTALEEIVALLHYKGPKLGITTGVKTELMYEAYHALRAAITLEQPRNKAIFGQYAFSTAAGVHQQGMLNNPATYEYVEPERFGRERQVLVSRHSGRVVVRYLLSQLGIEVDDAKLTELYESYVANQPDGKVDTLDALRGRLAIDLGSVVDSSAVDSSAVDTGVLR